MILFGIIQKNGILTKLVMKKIDKTTNSIKNSIHLENFDNIIDNFIQDTSMEIAKLYHTKQYRKAKRLEKKITNFLQRVKISRKIYLGQI